MAPSRIVTLATEIQVNTVKIDDYLQKNGLPPPSFDEDSPLMYQFPPDVIAAQEALSAALDELWWLNQGPVQTIITKAFATSVGLEAILKFKIHELVPLETGTTFQDLGDKTSIPVKKLTRLLRQAIADHFFCEPRPGYIKHTLATKALVSSPDLPACCEMLMCELGPAKMRTVDAITKWPQSEEPHHAGFNLAHNTEKNIFQLIGDHPERAGRFKGAMRYFQKSPGLEHSHAVRGFDWASLGKATVVDVGGSHGHGSIAIAREFPDLRFVVQDLPEVLNEGKTQAPAELADRVTFMAHDFFTEQPVKDAEVYYFRWILHDWSDKYCIRILRSLIPALKPGARVILSERCLEPPGTLPILQERADRDSDMLMLAQANAQERDESDWRELFSAASGRFKLEHVKRMEGSRLAIIVVRWD